MQSRNIRAVLVAAGLIATSVAANAQQRMFVLKSAPVTAAVDSSTPLIVELYQGKGFSSSLTSRLKTEASRAASLGRTPVLEFSAARCGICRLMDASLQHPRMRDVLRDMYVIRVDVDVWKTQLANTGYGNLSKLPLLVAIGVNGQPTGQTWSGAGMALDGDPSAMRPEYDDAYVGQVATALRTFFSTCQREFFRTLIG